jgi:hypothetical protein
MSYGYGLKTCREVLLHLASDTPIDDRMVHAFTEIGLINAKDDTSVEHYKEIKEWKGKYLSLKNSNLIVSQEGDLKSNDEERKKQLKKLSIELVWICTEVIEHNSRNTPKKNLL